MWNAALSSWNSSGRSRSESGRTAQWSVLIRPTVPYRGRIVGRPDRSADGRCPRLADLVQQLHELGVVDVVGLATLDPVELDRPQLVALLLVVPDDAGDAAQGAADRVVGHRLDQQQVRLVGPGGAGEIARLLHEHLVRAQSAGELLGEPLSGVDLVELDVPEGVPWDGFARGLHLGD